VRLPATPDAPMADQLTQEQMRALAFVDGFPLSRMQRYAAAGDGTGALGVQGVRDRLADAFPFLRELPDAR
jgi:hypothetical protein